jgi:hypothetical protein
MAQIAEDYVSPSVRWGICKQDYPDAVVEFSQRLGAEIGIPENFGGKDQYCVAQITLRLGDPDVVIGYKPISDARSGKGDHPSDAWNVLCTKALGRALKRAGYADTSGEMRVMVQYKQRNAEQDATRGGIETPPAVATSPMVTIAPGDLSHTSPLVTEVKDEELEAIIAEVEVADVWGSPAESEAQHALLKAKVLTLPTEYADRARESHEKLNGRQWPMDSVAQFNTLQNFIDSLHLEWEAAGKEDEES